MASCGVCLKNLSSKSLKVKCSDCEKLFHIACVKMDKSDLEYLNSEELPWRCPPCSQARRASMRFETDLTEGKLTLQDVMDKVLEVLENNKKMEKDLNKSSESVTEQLEENTKAVRAQTEKFEKCLKIIEDLKAENNMLKEKIAVLETRVEDVEQYSRCNTIEIHGIPEEKNEDVVGIVKEVGTALGMQMDAGMIDACHRMGKRPGSNNATPGIIVKFVRRIDKEEMLRKKRVKRNLSTRHMNMNTDIPIYINEALSPARRRLYAAARQVKRDKNLKYLWVRGGKIFVRKEDSAPVIQVTCQADLNKL